MRPLVRFRLPAQMVDATLADAVLLCKGGVGMKPNGFSWALIQAQRDLVELRLRMDGQVGASREVLGAPTGDSCFRWCRVARAAFSRITEVDR